MKEEGNMGEMMTGMKRSQMCGTVTEEFVGQTVTLMGWVQKQRDLGSLVFVDLRDRSGVVQLVFSQEEIDAEAFERARRIRSEYVLAVTGEVALRDEATVNTNFATGKIEVKVKELRVLSDAKTPPFYIEEDINVKEELRLKHRYLDLRRPDMQRTLMTRHKVTKIVRDYMDDNGFLEVETPMLTRSTPEGARDYLVPSRVHPGEFYALPQSPQLFKQLLMVSGMDRYFQITKCFRDEDLRADRQPEFTQMDMELSFVDQEDVIALNEGLMKKVFKEVMNIDLQTPFLRLTYQEAMDRYGSDKPDIRFGMELKDLSTAVKECGFKVFKDALANGGSVRAIVVEGGADFPRRKIDSLTDFVKIYKAKGLAWIALKDGEIKSQIAKFFTEEELSAIVETAGAKDGDLILIVADKDQIAYDALGALRQQLGEELELINKEDYKFLWVTDFPLLEYDEEENRYVAKHHPFTMPVEEDIPLLETDPSKVRAKAYDIVLNGYEIGGGSIRIHSGEIQELMFNKLGFSKEEAWERFGFLLEAFQYGVPPHGGLAYGLDRLVMILTGRDNIRDVIAFPKVKDASCPMTEAPGEVEFKQLEELHIQVIKGSEDEGTTISI